MACSMPRIRSRSDSSPRAHQIRASDRRVPQHTSGLYTRGSGMLACRSERTTLSDPSPMRAQMRTPGNCEATGTSCYLLRSTTSHPILGFQSNHACKPILTGIDENCTHGNRVAGNHRVEGAHGRADAV